MLCIKLLSLFVLILCLMPEPQVSAIFWVKKCNWPCPNTDKPIFTTTGKDCFVFRNFCYLNRRNCLRRRKGLPRLSLSNKANCQAKCRKTCGTNKSPICGEYAGTYTTFDNSCLLIKTACENGQAILKVGDGACPAQGL